MHHLDLDDDNFALASAEVTRHRAARRIVSDVLDIEADSQSYASRAKDRRLMDDITSRLLEPSTAYVSPQRVASSNNPSADQAIREAKRYLARLENELGAGGDDDYNSAAYGRSSIITKRERGIPVVYLGDDDMYIPVINKGHGQSHVYGGYSSVPRLSRVTSHYDTTDLASSRGLGLGLGGVYTSISHAYAPQHTSKTYDLNGYLDELPRTTTTTTHHHVPDVYPSKPTKRSASSFDLREKPTYNFKPSDYAAAARQFRPTMSDTRRRIRDLICTTRNDPHYYDD